MTLYLFNDSSGFIVTCYS